MNFVEHVPGFMFGVSGGFITACCLVAWMLKDLVDEDEDDDRL